MEQLLDTCLAGAVSPTLFPRLKSLMLSSLLCLGRHTVTDLICTTGRQFRDWTAAYRLFSKRRFNKDILFEQLRQQVIHELPPGASVVLALDDTRLRKCGKHTAGVSVMRDPLGLPYHVNLIRGQRFLEISIACPGVDGSARMLPADIAHAPLPVKPRRNALPAQWENYRLARREQSLGRIAAARLDLVRSSLDEDDAARQLICAVDGGYTNRTFLRCLPEGCTVIGRIRGDARLFFLPEAQPAHGRRRVYGRRAPTPKQLHQDQDVPWQEITVHFGAATHTVRVKTIAPLRWPAYGARDLRLVVVGPVKYRTTPEGRTLYREPGYLICTDPSLPLEELVQDYIWRWDIEHNFRDEKTVLGVGQAQVRTPASVELVPAACVAAYSLMLLAGIKRYGLCGQACQLPPAKWQQRARPRTTTQQLVSQLRYDSWHKQLISPGSIDEQLHTKPEKYPLMLAPALFYGAANA